MIKSCYIDGSEFERDGFPEGLYVYQSVMTFGERALHLASYIRLLGEASRAVLHRALSLEEPEAAALITKFLRRNGYPSAMPAHVELRHYLSGEVVLLGGEVSPYPKLGLRLVMPSGVDVPYDLPLSEHRSSVGRMAAEAARAEAESRGARVAVRVDRDGEACSVDDSELFVVKEYTVKTPRPVRSVEGGVVVDAIVRAGMQLEVVPLGVADLEDADEIFYADHRGVTALESFNSRPMMHILAEKIAAHV